MLNNDNKNEFFVAFTVQREDNNDRVNGCLYHISISWWSKWSATENVNREDNKSGNRKKYFGFLTEEEYSIIWGGNIKRIKFLYSNAWWNIYY